MASVQILPTESALVDVFPLHRVQVKRAWSDDWEDVDYLECCCCSESVAPSMPYAKLRWRSGTIKPEDGSAYVDRLPIDLKDWFVRVILLAGEPEPATTIGDFVFRRPGDRGVSLWRSRTVVPAGSGGAAVSDETVLFTGIVPEEEIEVGGRASGALLADQYITALGLEFLLDRACVNSAIITNDGVTPQRILMPVPFNENYITGFRQIGNRSGSMLTGPSIAGRADVQAYTFAAGGTVWTAHDILEYLLAWHAPGPDSGPKFQLTGQKDVLHSIIYPRVEWQNQTICQLLNALIDRRRGLGWCIRMGTNADDEEIAGVHVFTTTDETIAVGAATIPANSEQASITITEDIRIDRPLVSADTLTRYGSVMVIGEPIVVCFGASFDNNLLFKGWGTGDEASYVAGAGGTADENDAARAEEDLRYVFTRYLVSGGFLALPALNPGMTDDGYLDFTETGNIRQWGRSLLRALPVLKPTTGLDGGDPEFLEPMAFLWDETNEVWVQAESAGCDINILEHAMGLELSPPFNHLLAMNHWGDDAGESNNEPVYDYASLIATVAMKTDRCLSVVRSIPGGDPGRTLTIRVEGAELHYITGNAPTGVSDGTLSKPSFQILRDDSGKLRQIAAIAAAWYGKTRSTLRMGTREMLLSHPVGSFLTSVEDLGTGLSVNSPITEKLFDLERGLTAIATNYADLDPAAIVPRSEVSGPS